jgi:hypothetical protein
VLTLMILAAIAYIVAVYLVVRLVIAWRKASDVIREVSNGR